MVWRVKGACLETEGLGIGAAHTELMTETAVFRVGRSGRAVRMKEWRGESEEEGLLITNFPNK